MAFENMFHIYATQNLLLVLGGKHYKMACLMCALRCCVLLVFNSFAGNVEGIGKSSNRPSCLSLLSLSSRSDFGFGIHPRSYFMAQS
jgi:hypothetical protein